MPARMRTYCLLLLFVVTVSGCATTGRRTLFARPAKTPADSGRKVHDSGQEPGKEESPPREPLVAGNQDGIPPELQRRIDQQMQQLTPQQRVNVRSQLSGLSPAQQLRVLESLNAEPQRTQLAQNASPTPTGPAAANPAWNPGHSPLGAKGKSLPAMTAQAGPPLGPGGDANDPLAINGEPPITRASGETTPAEGMLPNGAGEATPASAESESPPPRRFPVISDWDKSLTWLGQRETQDPAPPAEPKPSLFGLPQILVPHGPSRGEAAPLTTRVDIPQGTPAQPPSQPKSLAPITAESKVWEDELRKLVSLLEADATVLRPGMTQAEQREYLRRQIALRMLYLVENEPERAQQVIAGIPDVEQEFWTSLFWGLSSYVDDTSNADPAMRATMTIDQLRAAIHHLQTKAHLQLANLTFSQSIRGFGNYDQYREDRFEAGQSVLLYCEVRNFASELTRDGEFRSLMKSVVEIFRAGESNELVNRTQFDATEDRSRTPRGDYYHSYRIDLPRHLAAGQYVLKLTVEDQVSNKLAVESIVFEIR